MKFQENLCNLARFYANVIANCIKEQESVSMRYFQKEKKKL